MSEEKEILEKIESQIELNNSDVIEKSNSKINGKERNKKQEKSSNKVGNKRNNRRQYNGGNEKRIGEKDNQKVDGCVNDLKVDKKEVRDKKVENRGDRDKKIGKINEISENSRKLFTIKELEDMMTECRNKLGLNDEIWKDLDWKLLILGFIHKSGETMIEEKVMEEIERKYKWRNYDQFEFHGDTVLEMLINQFLWSPELTEFQSGELTVLRSQLVQNNTLYHFMTQYGLQYYIIKDPSIQSEKLISDCFEALLGVLYYYLFYLKKLRYASLDILFDWFNNLWNVSLHFYDIIKYGSFSSLSQKEKLKLDNSIGSLHLQKNYSKPLSRFQFTSFKRKKIHQDIEHDITTLLRQRLEQDYTRLLEPEIRRRISHSIHKQVRNSLRQQLQQQLSLHLRPQFLVDIQNSLVSLLFSHFSQSSHLSPNSSPLSQLLSSTLSNQLPFLIDLILSDDSMFPHISPSISPSFSSHHMKNDFPSETPNHSSLNIPLYNSDQNSPLTPSSIISTQEDSDQDHLKII